MNNVSVNGYKISPYQPFFKLAGILFTPSS